MGVLDTSVIVFPGALVRNPLSALRFQVKEREQIERAEAQMAQTTAELSAAERGEAQNSRWLPDVFAASSGVFQSF